MRRENDAYFTSEAMMDALITHTKIDGAVLEPCVGTGVISKDLSRRGLQVFTNDISLEYGADYYEDATTELGWDLMVSKSDGVSWVITNPPFNRAFEILKLARRNVPNVALLLRLSFLEPTYARQDYLECNPPDSLIVLPRYSFTQDGKMDSVTCAWMVWSKEYSRKGIQVWRKV